MVVVEEGNWLGKRHVSPESPFSFRAGPHNGPYSYGLNTMDSDRLAVRGIGNSFNSGSGGCLWGGVVGGPH